MEQVDNKKVQAKKPRRVSLGTSLFILILLLVYLPLTIVSLYALRKPYGEINDQRALLHTNSVAMNQNIIASHLNAVNENVALLLDSRTIRDGLKELSLANSSEAGSEPEPVEPKGLYEQIDTPLTYNNISANRVISAITIFAGEDLAYYSLRYKTTEQALSRCVQINSKSGVNIPAQGMFIALPNSSGYVYFVREYTDILTGKEYGTIVIEMFTLPTYTFADKNAHMQYYEHQVDISQYPGMEYFICNDEGLILFSSADAQHGTNYNYSLYADALRQDSGIGEKYVVSHKYLSKQQLRVSFITPNESIYLKSEEERRDSILLFSIIGVITLLFILFCKDFIDRPFKALRTYCRQFASQPKIPPVFDPVFSDLEEVQDVIKANLDTIEEMQGVIMKNHIQMKDDEIQMLQSQINPHFLFNMLDVIGWQAVQDKSESVSEMISYLSELLRGNILQRRQEKITIGQELEYIKSYLALQQIRFGDRFSYTVNADEDILDLYYIPKLSIQPVVENCVIHGFKDIAYKGKLEIVIWEDRDDVVCLVKDNGRGFDATDFFEKAPSATGNPKSNHIALQNIQRRIQIMCGPTYGITIESEIGKGTMVTIILPIDDVNTAIR